MASSVSSISLSIRSRVAPIRRRWTVSSSASEKPRHLCDPRRRLPREQWDERPPALLASESAECGQHGQVGLAGATVLDALAVRDQRRTRTFGSSDEALDDCRLALSLRRR